jgi:histidyl-tRNA synthetase
MHDILPSEMPDWQRLEAVARDLFSGYGYAEIRVPVLEKTEVFTRAIGTATDVVEKEMYTFAARNGESLSLRPEGTAGVVRAVIQNGLLHGPVSRLWYMGPMFRHERPQRGRTRQFHQIGAEVFGAPGPDVDAELLALCQRLWRRLGLQGIRLELNSLGQPQERAAYREELLKFFSDRTGDLDEETIKRLQRNPLRVLDSKNPRVQEMLEQAPLLTDFLGEASQRHFDGVRDLLDALGVEYQLNPKLVRGLDYYGHTVFEWVTDELGAQGTVCAGGRYDGLVEIQGGKPCPGIGFAMGQERLVELMRAAGPAPAETPHAYFVMAGDAEVRAGLKLAEQVRNSAAGLRIVCNAGGGSFKAQFKRADRSGAQWAVVIGSDELQNECVTVKPLRKDQAQEQVKWAELAARLEQWCC